MTALVRILDSQDYDPATIKSQDCEKTVVHELLHIVLAPFHPNTNDEDNPHHILFEQTIEILARALVGLKRRTV